MNKQSIKKTILSAIGILICTLLAAQVKPGPVKPLSELQRAFVGLRFGMFIHFNLPTYYDQDWPDPDASPAVFNPVKLDCEQWAKAAVSAHMTYGCLTTKHHSGFCIWDTKSTDYSVMNSPYRKDVVREFTRAFRKNGLKVMLYYSILDTHHQLRPNEIRPGHIELVKKQLTELLSNYGQIDALIIDGWDAPWSRISYDDIPFREIYELIKSLQPNCLVMDLNGAKYPADALYYTDIKTYEMGAGQRLGAGENQMPALACLPLQSSWFWKSDFPQSPVKDPGRLVRETLLPLNKANCNFILNVAPNRDGLIDTNAMAALAQIGSMYKQDALPASFSSPEYPIISHNLAKFQPATASWSNDMNIMDFGNDDNFHTSWESNPSVSTPWYQIDLRSLQPFNTITIFENSSNIKTYKIQYAKGGGWITLFEGENTARFKLHRFNTVTGDKVRITIMAYDHSPSIAEFGIYNEAVRR